MFDFMTALIQLTLSRNPLAVLKLMLGMKKWDHDENSVWFDYQMCDKHSICRIRYDEGADLYVMEFCKPAKTKGGDFEVVETIEDVYNEDLKELFERHTGLYLSL